MLTNEKWSFRSSILSLYEYKTTEMLTWQKHPSTMRVYTNSTSLTHWVQQQNNQDKRIITNYQFGKVNQSAVVIRKCVCIGRPHANLLLSTQKGREKQALASQHLSRKSSLRLTICAYSLNAIMHEQRMEDPFCEKPKEFTNDHLHAQLQACNIKLFVLLATLVKFIFRYIHLQNGYRLGCTAVCVAGWQVNKYADNLIAKHISINAFSLLPVFCGRIGWQSRNFLYFLPICWSNILQIST